MLKAKVHASQTLALVQKVFEWKQAGKDVVSFAAGEPDFDTHPMVKEAAWKSLQAGNTKYVSSQGLLSLRQAIAEDYRERLGVSWVGPENVLLTAGAKQGIYLALHTILNPGDEVLIPKPFWVSYPHVAEAAGGRAVFCATQESQGFFPLVEDLERARTSKTKVLILSSPSNPAGTMIDTELLKKIVSWCQKHRIYFLFDEIYERLVLGQKSHHSVLEFYSQADSEFLISINAFSKSLSMTGWRLGYVVAHQDNIAALTPLQGQMMTCLPGFLQDGATVGLKSAAQVMPKWIETFQQRARLMVQELQKIPGARHTNPEGAFYICLNVEALMKARGLATDEAVASALLDEELVACVAGSSFGMDGWLRLSFATDESSIRKGVERIRRFWTKRV
jgi:aspartate aminotransferase